mmetsp:Transcript_57442/g.163121  ORF Transcript_57442/g.163121 Transcript_57442/m.163121 type:complete len:210 (-) Transcript_57442:812-1441(-)
MTSRKDNCSGSFAPRTSSTSCPAVMPASTSRSSFVRSTRCTARTSRNRSRRMSAPSFPVSSSPSLMRCRSDRGSSVSVAEKTNVCSCGARSTDSYTRLRMRSSSWKWPDSTSLSASSRTRWRRPRSPSRNQSHRSLSASLPSPMRAKSLPGVPTTIWGCRRSSRCCFSSDMPPTTHAACTTVPAAAALMWPCTCTASSRVGNTARALNC